MPPRTIKTTATAFSGCSTTQLKGAISDRGKRMSIAWRKSVSTSSTSAWPKEFLSRASTVVCWQIVHLAGSRSREPSMPAVKPANNCCWALIKPSNMRSRRAAVKMYPTDRNARPGFGQRARQRHRRSKPRHGRDPRPCRRRGGSGHRRLRECLLPFDQCQGLQRDGDLASPQTRRSVREPLFHSDPSNLYSGRRSLTRPN